MVSGGDVGPVRPWLSLMGMGSLGRLGRRTGGKIVHDAEKCGTEAMGVWLPGVLRRAVAVLEQGFVDGDDVTGSDHDDGVSGSAGHFLGVVLEDLFLAILDPLDGDVAGVCDFGVSTGHADGLQEGDLRQSLHIVGAGLLDLSKDGEEFLGILTDRDADLGMDEVSVPEAGGDHIRGLSDGVSSNGHGTDEGEQGIPVSGHTDDAVKLGLLKDPEVEEVVRGEVIVLGALGLHQGTPGKKQKEE
jgi:hypothetical protein